MQDTWGSVIDFFFYFVTVISKLSITKANILMQQIAVWSTFIKLSHSTGPIKGASTWLM